MESHLLCQGINLSLVDLLIPMSIRRDGGIYVVYIEKIRQKRKM